MARIRDAAGVIACRQQPEGWQVMLVQRGRRGRFFPGFHAFPGGALESSDQDHPDPWRKAAARELWEETGLWVGPRQPPEEFRRKWLDGRLDWADLVEAYPLQLENLLPAGIRTTPDYALIRFRARFFLWECPVDQVATIWPGELETGQWWELPTALSHWQDGHLFWAAPTQDSLLCLQAQPHPLLAAQALTAIPEDTPDPIRVYPGLSYLPLVTPTLPPARHTLCFLLGQERLVVVDPGSADPEQLARLASVVADRAVEGVLFTHHHPDHVGGLDWCREQAWPLWGSAECAQQLDCHWDRTLVDGEWVQDWQVLLTPGHAPGHLALWQPQRSVLLSGDLVSGASTILIPAEPGAMTSYLSSLRRVIALRPRLVLPSHGGPYGPGSELLEATLEHRLAREQKVLASIHDQDLDFEELLQQVYHDLDPPALPLARIALASHLHRLSEEGLFSKGQHWIQETQGR